METVHVVVERQTRLSPFLQIWQPNSEEEQFKKLFIYIIIPKANEPISSMQWRTQDFPGGGTPIPKAEA